MIKNSLKINPFDKLRPSALRPFRLEEINAERSRSIKNLKLKIFVLVFFLLFVVFPNKADASNLSLGIYPPLIKIQAKPPSNVKTPVVIQNHSDQPVSLKITFKPFTASSRENGEVLFISDKSTVEKFNSFTLKNISILDEGQKIETLDLAPKQQKQLSLIIDIPKDESISDYYFSIVFIAKEINLNEVSKKTNNLNIENGIGTNIILSVIKNVKANGTIEEFTSSSIFEKGPVEFNVRVKNNGDHVINPTGYIIIKNIFGQIVGKVDLLSVNILKDTVRSIPDSEYHKKNSIKEMAQKSSLNNKLEIPYLPYPKLNLTSPKATWGEIFLLGPYTATLTLTLSDQGPIYTRSIYFFALPLKYLSAIIVAVLIILIITVRIKKQLS